MKKKDSALLRFLFSGKIHNLSKGYFLSGMKKFRKLFYLKV